MPITITTEINPILHYLNESGPLQCRIDLRRNSDQHCQFYTFVSVTLFRNLILLLVSLHLCMGKS